MAPYFRSPFLVAGLRSLAAAFASPALVAALPDLIDRRILIGNADKFRGRVSPDGQTMSWLASLNGVQNVWVAPIDNVEAARVVTNSTVRPVRSYYWTADSKYVLYAQDSNGNENDHVFRTDVEATETIDLTPVEDGVKAQIHGYEYNQPNTLLVTMNDRDPAYFDLHKVDVAEGTIEKIAENTEEYSSWMTDEVNELRGAIKANVDGSFSYFLFENESPTELFTVGADDALSTSPLALVGNSLYMLDTRDRDKAAFTVLDLVTNEMTVIGESDEADVAGVRFHAVTSIPLAYTVNYLKPTVTVLDDTYGEFVAAGEAEYGEGNFFIVYVTPDDSLAVFVVEGPTLPQEYRLYNRTSEAWTDMFLTRPDLNATLLQPMQTLEIPSRDGLILPSYLTLPGGVDMDEDGIPDNGPVPMVLLVHGGPWARDFYGYSAFHQFLANRGYAVLAVNFRASTGFGKAFLNAGIREWSGKMHDDLIDAVNFTVDRGVADPDRVAIMGGSYGGYATLVGLSFTPDVFACGVDIVGISNLVTLIQSTPSYWESFLSILYLHIGNPANETEREDMLARSPITHVDSIVKPLLIGQGENDPRVPKAESDQIVEAMAARDQVVTYLNYPDEGHGFARPENSLSFFAVTEHFLKDCLGGRVEEFGEAFEGSSAEVLHGVEYVPGLADQLVDVTDNGEDVESPGTSSGEAPDTEETEEVDGGLTEQDGEATDPSDQESTPKSAGDVAVGAGWSILVVSATALTMRVLTDLI